MKIALDPGHGLSNRKWNVYDSGAVGRFEGKAIEEAGTCLMLCLTLKFKIAEAKLDFWMTRTDADDHAPLLKRVDNAEDARCTRYLAIHLNSSNGKAHGTETYYRNDADRVWASVVHKAAVQSFNLKDRGLKKEGDSQHNRLAIFDFFGPACLCEVGFIDYGVDIASIMNRNARIDFASRIVAYLRKL